MPAKYYRYALETKLRVVDTARNDGNWERIASELGVKLNTARHWVRRHVHGDEPVQARLRGGRASQKVTSAMVEFLLEQIRYDPDLTLRQLADRLENETGVRVAPQTIKNHVDAACFTMKQLHKEPQYMNTSINKEKRRDYLVILQEYQAAGKVILYIDETNFNLWSTRTRGRSLKGKRAVKKVFAGGGQNMHVIACISQHGLVYFETRFGSNRYTNTNDFIRSLLRHVAQQGEISLSDVVLVLENAPCHCRAEVVFGESEFEQATLLRLGP
ncbi:hypothetical protein PF008_g5360 [Phytophthora fragariae]|uniref:Tc1-like transposase DDE domain-containing protein n=1 Tax=Phytophthora fragariae TaxID=53985 RepID=A0A6G0SA99_9STRA|nr:hypothetical protein PF008_g5360 [Phytophthora fragariae]